MLCQDQHMNSIVNTRLYSRRNKITYAPDFKVAQVLAPKPATFQKTESNQNNIINESLGPEV